MNASAGAPSTGTVQKEILALEAELALVAKLGHTTKVEVATLEKRLRQLKAKAGM